MTGSFILPAMAKSIRRTKKEEVEDCIEVTRLEPVFDGPRRSLPPPAHQFANYEEVLQQQQQPHFSLRAYLLQLLKAAKRLFKIGLIVSIPLVIAGMLFLV